VRSRTRTLIQPSPNGAIDGRWMSIRYLLVIHTVQLHTFREDRADHEDDSLLRWYSDTPYSNPIGPSHHSLYASRCIMRTDTFFKLDLISGAHFARSNCARSFEAGGPWKGRARKFKQVLSVACHVPWSAYRDHHHSGVGVDFLFFPLSRLVSIFAPSDVMPEHLGRTDGQGNQSVISALNRVGNTMVPDDYPIRHEILVSAYA
jgi:hypothetical protein